MGASNVQDEYNKTFYCLYKVGNVKYSIFEMSLLWLLEKNVGVIDKSGLTGFAFWCRFVL